MSKSMNPVKQAIKTYLDNRAKTDELFAVAYAKPNKNTEQHDEIVKLVQDNIKLIKLAS